ncbi:MAG TPA: diacylglycerol kinase family protein [Actinopolymorphaceae bacterium]
MVREQEQMTMADALREHPGRGGMLVVANREAAAIDRHVIEQTLATLREAGPVEYTEPVGTDQLGQVVDDRGDRPLIVMGGDGALHDVVALLHRRNELDRCDIGLIPVAARSDLARNLRIPLDPVRAARRVLRGRPRTLDLFADDAGGVVVSAVHMGIGAEEPRFAWPLRPEFGPLALPVGALAAGFTSDGWRLDVEIDGEIRSREGRPVLMVALANAVAIGGGTARVVPTAVPDDGLIDVLIAQPLGPLARMGYAIALRRGTHLDREDVLNVQGHRVTVRGEPFPVNSDGDVSMDVTERTWSVTPAGWRLIF